MLGTVSWFNKGFGIAEGVDRKRYFLHPSKMDDATKQAINNDAFEGESIEFESEPGLTARGIAATNIHFA